MKLMQQEQFEMFLQIVLKIKDTYFFHSCIFPIRFSLEHWYKLFRITSGSHKIHVLPIFHFCVYCLHMETSIALKLRYVIPNHIHFHILVQFLLRSDWGRTLKKLVENARYGPEKENCIKTLLKDILSQKTPHVWHKPRGDWLGRRMIQSVNFVPGKQRDDAGDRVLKEKRNTLNWC